MADGSSRARLAGLVGPAGAVAAGTGVANLLGYALTVTGARVLVPAEFGAFSALLAVVIVGNVAALAVQATVARDLARGHRVAHAVRGGLVIAVTVGLLLAWSAPLLAAFLSLGSAAPAVAAAVAIAALAAAGPALGVAQGRERFRRLALLVAGQAALRVAGGIAGMAMLPTAGGALVGMAAGLIVAAVAAWLLVRPEVRGAGPAGPAIVDTLGWGGLLLGFVIMTNADVVLARHVLSPVDSGLYGAGAIFTKIAFWLPQFVPLLAFPALADPARRQGAIRLGLATVGACGAVLVAGTALLSEAAVAAVAGGQYDGLASWVAGFTGLGALFAVSHLLVYARLASGDRATTVVVWVVLAGYVTVVEVAATTIAGVLGPAVGAAALIALWGLVRERAVTSR